MRPQALTPEVEKEKAQPWDGQAESLLSSTQLRGIIAPTTMASQRDLPSVAGRISGIQMPIRNVIDKERRLVITTGWDRVTLAEVLDHQEQLLKDPDFNPEFNQLIDGTGVTDYALSGVEVRMIANRKLFSPTSRRALVVASTFIQGMGRMFQAYYEMSKMASPMSLFHDRDSALKWLQEGT